MDGLTNILIIVGGIIIGLTIILTVHFLFYKALLGFWGKIERFMKTKSWSKTKRDLVLLGFVIIVGLVLIIREWLFG